jgi:transposase
MGANSLIRRSKMISMHNFEKIRELARNGLKPAKIAAQLGINRKTVSKYLGSNSPPCYPKERDGRTREDHFLAYEERVKVLLRPPSELSNVEIFEMIKDEGYKGSERTVQRRIAELKSAQPKERFFEQEYQPGEQSQFDFKESVDIAFHDGVRKVQFVFGTLPCSDKYFIKGYPRTNFAVIPGPYLGRRVSRSCAGPQKYFSSELSMAFTIDQILI